MTGVKILCLLLTELLKTTAEAVYFVARSQASSANFKCYASSLRDLRLVSSLPHNVFQKPVNPEKTVNAPVNVPVNSTENWF
jgi:hypothetical protein